jgi:mannose-1-phosphate guanylyltransferase
MEAIILAGGFGTRLRPLTYSRAKPLLPILNKPMIYYLIKSLPKEINKVILAVNYRRNQIEDYFINNNPGKEIIVNDEPKPLGTGGAVKFAEKHITESFFVLNSDIICSINLSDMIKYHKKKNAVATISLWPVENVTEFGVVDIKNNGNIIRFVEKPPLEEAPSNLINAGAYFLQTEVLDYIDTGRLVSMEKEIFPQIIDTTQQFYGFEFKGYWIDVGRIQSYIDVNKLLLKNQQLAYFNGSNCKINGKVNRASIGDNVVIDNHSFLDSIIIFNNVKIGKHVHMKNCVIGENCIIKNNASLKNSVVGDNETITENMILENKMIWNQPIPEGYPQKQIGNVLGE